MEIDNKKPHCPVLDVDGVISGGKQFVLVKNTLFKFG